MARKCIVCNNEYHYCRSCSKDAKKETWYALYDTENCKNISQALADYKFDRITKEEARELLSKCDLTIELSDYYRGEINAVMPKKRSPRAKTVVVEEIVDTPKEFVEEIIEEAQIEPQDGVVTLE